MKTLEVKNRNDWRAWLATHHDQETEIWLVYFKKQSGQRSIEYSESLDEALCYGWIDSIIKKLDEIKYVRKFTPRKDDSKWSLVNVKRAEKLIQDGLMTEYGLRKINAAKASGSWQNPGQKPELNFEMPEEFALALRQNPSAKQVFEDLAPTHQKRYIIWISTAKRPETRAKRIMESIKLLTEGKKLGLK